MDNGDEPVPRRSELLVPIDSEDNEDPQATVVRIARRLGENTHALGFPVIYPPFFLSRFDPVTVIGREITRAGVWRETYRARLTAVSCGGKRGTCRAVGSPIARQFVPARARRNRNRLPRSAALAKDWLGRP